MNGELLPKCLLHGNMLILQWTMHFLQDLQGSHMPNTGKVMSVEFITLLKPEDGNG